MRRTYLIPSRAIQPLYIVTQSPLANGTQGSAYSYQMTANGGTAPYTWSLVSQTGTNAFSVSSGGLVSSAAANAETDSLTIKATDSVGTQVQGVFSVQVVAFNPLTITTSSPLPGAAVGSAYSDTLAATGGTPPYVWSLTSSTGANTWVVSGAGVLTGTPSAAETDSLVIKVTDNVAATASKTFSLQATVGGAGFAVESGTLTYDTGLGGTGYIYARWDRPTLNSDGSTKLRDMKTFQVDVGTSSGGTQILNSVDLSTTPQKGATEVKVTGLAVGTTYYVQVRCVDAAGNVSTTSTPAAIVAVAPHVPSYGSNQITSLPFTISASGDWEITANVSGTLTVNASNVYVNGHGNTLSFSGAANGVVINSGCNSVELDSIVFNPASGTTGDNVLLSTAVGSGHKIHNCTIVCNAPTAAAISNDGGGSLNFLRVYANTCKRQNLTGGTSSYAIIGTRGNNNMSNVYFYGNTVTYSGNTGSGTGSGDRCAVIGAVDNYESWANTVSITGGTQNYYVGTYANSGAYDHDNIITISGDNYKIYAKDGENAVGAWYLWNTYNLGACITLDSGSESYGMRPRSCDAGGPIIDGLYMGYNVFDYSGAASGTGPVWGTAPGDNSSGGGAHGTFAQKNLYYYQNVHQNVGANATPLHFYGGAGVSTMYSWNNNWTIQTGPPSGLVDTFDMNNDSFTSVASTQNTWNAFNSTFSGGSGLINIVGSWSGFNPANDTPAAPNNVRQVA